MSLLDKVLPKKAVDKLPIKKKDEIRTIDAALDYQKAEWRDLFYDITTKPSPEGAFAKDLGGFGNWDLKKFEDYIKKTYGIALLPSVLSYKAAAIMSKKKGYGKYEAPRG